MDLGGYTNKKSELYSPKKEGSDLTKGKTLNISA